MTIATGMQRGAVRLVDVVLAHLADDDSSSHWHPSLTKEIFRDGVVLRILAPELIRQGLTKTCGPTTIIQLLAEGDPNRYVRFACDLFLDGEATLKVGTRSWTVKPKRKVLTSPFPGTIGSSWQQRFEAWRETVRPEELREFFADSRFADGHLKNVNAWANVDWVTSASLRSSSNIFDWSAFSGSLFGTTHIVMMSAWLRRLGFEQVKTHAYVHRRGLSNLQEAITARDAGHSVVLSVHASVLGPDPLGTITGPNHWVSLGKSDEGTVTVITWGRRLSVNRDRLLRGYFGHISARLGLWLCDYEIGADDDFSGMSFRLSL